MRSHAGESHTRSQRLVARENQVVRPAALENTQCDAEGYRRLWRRDPHSLRFAELADLARRQGHLPQAAALCARGLLLHPSYATGRVVMGDIFWDQNLEDRAEQEWQEALRIDPRHPRAHLRLGELYLRRGDLPRARAAVEAALTWNPESAEARALLARVSGRPSALARAGAGRAAPPPMSPARCQEAVAAVSACASVSRAAVVNSDGSTVAGTDAHPEAGSAAVAQLIREARRITPQLGGGRLRGALLQGTGGSLRCLVLEQLLLIAGLEPGVSPSAADAEIEQAIAGLGGPQGEQAYA